MSSILAWPLTIVVIDREIFGYTQLFSSFRWFMKGCSQLQVKLCEIIFLTPKHPQVPPLGHDPGNKMKIMFDMYSIFYLW